MSRAAAKLQLKLDIKAISDELKTYDGTTGKTQADAIERQAELLSEAIDKYLMGVDLIIPPQNIAAGGLSNTGGPVAAANNVIVTKL